jgi:hypothetical protein
MVNRDKKWFEESLPKFKQMWDYVEFFRGNKDKLDILLNYIASLKIKTNNKIMKVIETLANIPPKNIDNYDTNIIIYNDYINKIIKETLENNMNNKLNEVNEDDGDSIPGFAYDTKTYAF